MSNDVYTVSRFGLTTTRIVHLMQPFAPPPAPRVVDGKVLRARAKWRSDSRKLYKRQVRQRIANAEACILITHHGLMAIILEVAVARAIPAAAILSRLQHVEVVAARDEVYQRANVELPMSPTAIASHFKVSVSAVSTALARDCRRTEPAAEYQLGLFSRA